MDEDSEAFYGFDEPARQTLAAWAIDNYVRLVLFARIGNGTWSNVDVLTRFSIDLDTDPILVQINDEPFAWTHARAARSVAPGENVLPIDVESEQVGMPALAGRRITAKLVDRRWEIDARLATHHPAMETMFAIGVEFVNATKLLLDKRLSRPALECAFHAVESLVKAELMAYGPIVEEFADAKSHASVRGAYNSWAKLGNTDPEFANLLNELVDVRLEATYPRNKDSEVRAPEDLFERLTVLCSHVREVINNTGPRIVTVVAHRALASGEIIGKEDVGIRPRRASGG